MWVGGTIHHLPHPRIQDHSTAHGAGFQCDIQGAVIQPPVPTGLAGHLYGTHLGVSQWRMGHFPVIAGSGSNSSEMQKHKSVIYSQMGAAALLCISPYYVKTNEEGMYRHFMMSADAATAPIILYNVPGRTGCKISPDVVRRLSVHPNVMAIKEASGDIGYAMKVARYLSDDFTMYSGNDDITIPLMSLGASGVISVWANVMPRTVHDMVTDYLAGRHEKALQTQLRYLDLINALFMEVNPIPVKTAMNLMGLQAGHFRMPMYPMAPENLGRLKRIMREAGLPVQEAAE